MGGIISTLVSLGILRYAGVDGEAALAAKRRTIVRASESMFSKVTLVRCSAISCATSRTARRDGKVVQHFLLEMTSESTDPSMYFDWDAETGDLIRAYARMPAETDSEGTTMPRERAARISKSWLEKLGIARMESMWKLAGPPMLQRNRTYWSQWIAPGVEVTIAIRCGNGNLLCLSVRRLHLQGSGADPGVIHGL
jgi:hypothetical protein